VQCTGRSGKLLLVFASIVVLGAEYRGTHGHIFVSRVVSVRVSQSDIH
jgi:hypothetical protein